MLCSVVTTNPFVLTSYSLDVYHSKAAEQVCVAHTHPKHDLLCTLNQQTSQPPARCIARRRVAMFLEANNVHLQPIKHPTQWKESFTMPQSCTPNVQSYILSPTHPQLWLRTNKSVESTCVCVRVQMMNPFVLTSYSFDKQHGKAAEQVHVTCSHPKHDLLCTRLLHPSSIGVGPVAACGPLFSYQRWYFLKTRKADGPLSALFV